MNLEIRSAERSPRRWGGAFVLTIALPLVVATAAVSACDSSRDRAQTAGSAVGAGDRTAVVTTLGMIKDAAGRIGGSCVEATALMGPGVDPHVYRASAGDVDTLRSADVIVYGGLLLEGRMADVLGRIGQRIPTLAVLETVDESRLLASTSIAGHYDPHLWMSVSLWADAISAIEAFLAERRPDCTDRIREASAAYRAELLALHGWVAASVATIPASQRALVTAHDAFNYFGRAYGMEVIGIQGVSTEAEASVSDIRNVVDTIVARRIPAIFIESSVNPRNIEAVRAAARDRGFEVALGGELFSDAMGADGTWRGTYIGMIRSNVERIVTALGGQVAPWPDELAQWADRWGIE